MDSTLKILLINHNWLQDELRALGVEVFSVGLHQASCDLNLQSPEISFTEILSRIPFQPNRVLYFDNSAMPWITGLEESAIPSLFLSVDCHHHHHWHPYLGTSFDTILVAQRDYMQDFMKWNKDVRWFPLWTNRTFYFNDQRPYPATFVGTMDPKLNPHRIAFFAELQTKAPVQVFQGDYGLYYPKSLMVVNQVVKGDLNFRVFEAMAAGALLITPKITNGQEDLFTPHEDMIVYETENTDQAAKAIQFFLEHETDRKRIAMSGYQKVIRSHTSTVRAKALVQMMQNMQRYPSPFRYYGTAVACLATHIVCRTEGLTWGKGKLFEGANCILKSASLREPVPDEFFGVALVFQHELQMLELHEEAIHYIKELVRIFPESEVPKLALALAYTRANREADAKEVLKDFPGDRGVMLHNLEDMLTGALSLTEKK